MSAAQLCLLKGRTVEPVVSGDKPHKTIRIAKRPEINPAEFHEYALIVRCKDCKLYEPPEERHLEGAYVRLPGRCKIVRQYVQEVTHDGFCAWGEPREGSDNE